MDQGDLFPASAGAATERHREPSLPGVADAPDAPLSTRMRPRSPQEIVGQGRVTAPGSPLGRALSGQSPPPSLILWGPPGSGKTTLAAVLAQATSAAFEAVSATSSGVADLRRAVERAAIRQRHGQPTVLFIDEIHRFNKGQQDAILPHVESGVVRLLGATTENPGFQVNAALLSRARVVRLETLTDADVSVLIRRALSDTERGLGTWRVALADDAEHLLVQLCGGDARVALDTLEVAATAARQRADPATISAADVEAALQSPTVHGDRAGDEHYWVASALIKSLRGSDPDAAVYWLARLLEAGDDPLFAARRMVILAAEDIGLADPHALTMAVAAHQACHVLGMPEAALPLTEAALYLAMAPKSNSVVSAYGAAAQSVQQTRNLPVPLYLRNAPTALARSLGHGVGYRYSHDEPGGIGDQQYLPDAVRDEQFFSPSDHGAEAEVRQRWAANQAERDRRRRNG